MKPWQKILISSLSNGVIASGGAITAVIVEVGSSAPISGITWLMAGIAGLMAMAKDWKTYTATVPK